MPSLRRAHPDGHGIFPNHAAPPLARATKAGDWQSSTALRPLPLSSVGLAGRNDCVPRLSLKSDCGLFTAVSGSMAPLPAAATLDPRASRPIGEAPAAVGSSPADGNGAARRVTRPAA